MMTSGQLLTLIVISELLLIVGAEIYDRIPIKRKNR